MGYFRYKDFLINLIPIKSIRRKVKYLYGTFPGNSISKFAYRIADNPISTLLITAYGHDTPIVFVPSMHDSMYDSVSENVEKLKKDGKVQ